MSYIKTTIALIIFLLINGTTYSQTNYKLDLVTGVNMKLSGTSTLHKWNMNSRTFSGNAQFGVNPANANQLTSIKSLTFSLPVLNLKSNDRGLDKNAYKALKSGAFKNIVYKLTTASVQPGTGNRYLVKTTGELSIAGVTNVIDMDVYCMVNNDASITCNGSEHLKMTDYAVQPPSFMMGAMKTGDEVMLQFIMVYRK